MSEENVERFVEAIEAFNRWGHRGDPPGLDRFMDPEIRFKHHLAAMQGDSVGLDGVRRWFVDVAASFADAQVHLRDVRDLGDDRVLALGTLRATGRESGVRTGEPFTVVARFREGRIAEYTDFADEDRALEAAGLSE